MGTTSASLQGGFYVLRTTSSLYHLLLLGFQRFYAIKWPLKYKRQGFGSTFSAIMFVWAIAFAASLAPVWASGLVTYAYYSIVMMYNLTSATNEKSNVLPLMVFCLFIFPFVSLTVSTVATVAYTHLKTTKSIKTSNASLTSEAMEAAVKRRESGVCHTVALMQGGFTITLVPVIVVVVLFETGALTCDSVSAPYFVCFYLAMANSLVNVLIYSARDERYREPIREILSMCLHLLEEAGVRIQQFWFHQ